VAADAPAATPPTMTIRRTFFEDIRSPMRTKRGNKKGVPESEVSCTPMGLTESCAASNAA